MDNMVTNTRCDCGSGYCKERHGRKISGCMVRSGGYDGDLLPGVSPCSHPEDRTESDPPCIESWKLINE